MQYSNRQSKYSIRELKRLIDTSIQMLFDDELICRRWQNEGIQLQVTVSFVGPRKIRQLNQQFREIDKTTDVLSFPMLEMQDGELLQPLATTDFDYSENTRVLFLGDVIINVDQAYRQAAEFGHSREREIAYLCVHSLLHLLGYDHMMTHDENTMKKRQNRIMELMQLAR